MTLHIRGHTGHSIDVIGARLLLLLAGSSGGGLHSLLTLRYLYLVQLLPTTRLFHPLLLLLLLKQMVSPCLLLSLLIASEMVLHSLPLLFQSLVLGML